MVYAQIYISFKYVNAQAHMNMLHIFNKNKQIINRNRCAKYETAV